MQISSEPLDSHRATPRCNASIHVLPSVPKLKWYRPPIVRPLHPPRGSFARFSVCEYIPTPYWTKIRRIQPSKEPSPPKIPDLGKYCNKTVVHQILSHLAIRHITTTYTQHFRGIHLVKFLLGCAVMLATPFNQLLFSHTYRALLHLHSIDEKG